MNTTKQINVYTTGDNKAIAVKSSYLSFVSFKNGRNGINAGSPTFNQMFSSVVHLTPVAKFFECLTIGHVINGRSSYGFIDRYCGMVWFVNKKIKSQVAFFLTKFMPETKKLNFKIFFYSEIITAYTKSRID